MKYLKKITLLLMFGLLALTLCGCQEVKSVIEEHLPDNSEDEPASGYNIYYIDNEETQVKAFPYQLESTTQSGIIDECLQVLAEQPSNEDFQPVLSKVLSVDHYEYDEETAVLALYFDSQYTALSSQKEILVRCALVKTLTQFDSIVSFVEINADGSWITDSEGQPLKMNTDDFAIGYESESGSKK